MLAAFDKDFSQTSPRACLYENSNRLVSLGDMLKVYAGNFVAVGILIQKTVANYAVIAAPGLVMDKDSFVNFGESISRIERDCKDLGLVHTAEIVAFHERRLRSREMTYNEAAIASGEIVRIYQSEIRNCLFLHVKSARASSFDALILSDEARAAFPLSILEIRDAGTCYALEQETASVMHSMRALESPLCCLAVEFSVSTERDQWHKIIGNIQTKVNGMSQIDGADWRERQEFYAPACMEFRYFKDAWRNHAMHARLRADASESKRVLDHVIVFIEHLSSRLKE